MKKPLYSPAFKAQMVRELPKEEKLVSQLAAKHGSIPTSRELEQGCMMLFPLAR